MSRSSVNILSLGPKAQKQVAAQILAQQPAPKPSKYHATSFTDADGVFWHSIAEHKRWCELLVMEKAGVISHLERQVAFPLTVNGAQLGKYLADFVYFEGQSRTTEDFKGFDTPLSRWKRKHVAAQYHFDVRVTGPAAQRKRRKVRAA